MLIKSKKGRIFSIFGIFVMTALIFMLSPLQAQAEESEVEKKVKVSVSVTNSGVPAAGNVIYAANYEVAYLAISSGSISEDIVNSAAWLDADSKVAGIIQVAGYQIGKGITHDESETTLIISQLFRTNYDLLQTINQSNNGIFGTFTTPSNFVIMHDLTTTKKEYTDKNGIATAEVKEGMVAFVNSNKKLLYLGKVNSKTGRIRIDGNASEGMTLSIKNLEENKTHTLGYTVSYNQSIEYQLTIQKEFLNPVGDTIVALKPDSNLIIDSTSIENTKRDLIQQTVASPIAFDPNGGQFQMEKIAREIGKTYLGQKLFSYVIKVPNGGQNVTISIKARLTPTVSLERTVIQSVSDITNTREKKMSLKINAFDNPKQSFRLTANILTARGEGEAVSANVNTSGINFVEADTGKEIFASGATYLLGKKTDDGTFLYDNLGNWSEVKDLTQVKTTDYISIKGGSKYVIGLTKGEKIPVNQERFNYDFKKNTEINQSLIQIFGLGRGDYCLIPVTPAKGYQLQNTFDFSVFLNYGATSNGNQLVINNLSFPTNESYKLNGLIPDYIAGQNGYTVLPVSSTGKTTLNKWTKILIPIGGIIFIIFIVGMMLVKVG